MLYNLALIEMKVTRNLILITLTILVIGSCAQQQPVVVRDSVVDSAVSSTEEQLPAISVEMLKERIDSIGTDVFVLDVRMPMEYNGPLGHIEGAHSIPLQELGERLDELTNLQDRPIYVICHSGGRSARATRMLLDAGFQAVNVTGGMLAWSQLIEKLAEINGNPD